LRDLIARFPVPIALLDDEGRALFVNDGFERTYGAEVLDSAPLQDMIRKPVAGWKTVTVPCRGQAQIEIQAQVLQVRGNSMLILDSATDAELGAGLISNS